MIVLDRARATDLGVSGSQAASTLRTMVTGERAGTFQDADKDVNIVVRLPQSDRDSLDKVMRLPIATNRGGQVPISSIAGTLSESEPAKIDRENRQRQVLVAANAMIACLARGNKVMGISLLSGAAIILGLLSLGTMLFLVARGLGCL